MEKGIMNKTFTFRTLASPSSRSPGIRTLELSPLRLSDPKPFEPHPQATSHHPLTMSVRVPPHGYVEVLTFETALEMKLTVALIALSGERRAKDQEPQERDEQDLST